METFYETLKLKPGASARDVKAAFRRLAKEYHPDAAGGGGDAIRFTRVHEAYRSLLGEMDRKPSGPGRYVSATAGWDWRFEGVADRGAEVVYMIRVTAGAAAAGLEIVLPWQAEDACPRCLGAGHTLAPIFGGPHLAKVRCPKCGGKGVVRRNSNLRVALTPEMIRQGRVRLKGLGHYQPTRGVRGDLVLEIHQEYHRPGGGRLYNS
ncbi:MAG: DnaJ domain-containing protein [Thermodesulfobacteriota bacterium]